VSAIRVLGGARGVAGALDLDRRLRDELVHLCERRQRLVGIARRQL
jgi:hypothetical protein